MDKFASFLVPGCVALVLSFGCFRRVPVFEVFTQGAKEGLQNCLSILPTLVGLLMGISMLKASGAFDVLSSFLAPALQNLGIPADLIPLAFMKPVSGSGSTALLTEIFSSNGPDSFAGRVASVLCASSETTFYCTAVYFGSIHVRNTRHAIPAALTADVAACVFSCLTVRLLFP